MIVLRGTSVALARGVFPVTVGVVGFAASEFTVASGLNAASEFVAASELIAASAVFPLPDPPQAVARTSSVGRRDPRILLTKCDVIMNASPWASCQGDITQAHTSPSAALPNFQSSTFWAIGIMSV
ncbi:MAG: hypothetical protein RBU30_16445 [Polyangia bacterium]|nr:hypothetical protein [Polyangia bacterium]